MMGLHPAMCETAWNQLTPPSSCPPRPCLKIPPRATNLRKEARVATTNDAMPNSAFVPILTVDDLQKSISFYEALGFAISQRWEDKGTLQGVMMQSGHTELGLNQDDWQKGRDRQKGIGVRLAG